MGNTSQFQPLIDRARQAMYAAALVVVIGSLWTIAWANSLDDHSRPAASDRSATPDVPQVAPACPCAVAGGDIAPQP